MLISIKRVKSTVNSELHGYHFGHSVTFSMLGKGGGGSRITDLTDYKKKFKLIQQTSGICYCVASMAKWILVISQSEHT